MSNKYGSLDIRFSMEVAPSILAQVGTNVTGKDGQNNSTISVKVGTTTHSGVYFATIELLIGEVTIEQSDFKLHSDVLDLVSFRVFLNNDTLSISLDGAWIYYHPFESVNYASPITSYIKALGGTLALLGARRLELPDGRDGIFVDYESNAESAIQSVLQQRPVQIWSSPTRSLLFTYDAIRDELDALRQYRYSKSNGSNSGVASDGIVYYDEVAVVIDEDTARDVGFITRMFRMSELSTGAVEATKTAMRIAREMRDQISYSGRLDLRLEPGDVITTDIILAGTGRVISERAIIDNVNINISDANYTMNGDGRITQL